LRSAGLRVTAARRAVLVWLAEHPHSTAEAVRSGVLAHLGSVSQQAVYDVLNAFIGAGLVRRIEPAGGPALFERRVGDNHHHLVCRRCGRTEDVDCARGAAPCLTPQDHQRFVVDEAEVVFWGLCPSCAPAQRCDMAG
jgi:Fur family ferric uptake transcriptional regulator